MPGRFPSLRFGVAAMQSVAGRFETTVFSSSTPYHQTFEIFSTTNRAAPLQLSAISSPSRPLSHRLFTSAFSAAQAYLPPRTNTPFALGAARYYSTAPTLANPLAARHRLASNSLRLLPESRSPGLVSGFQREGTDRHIELRRFASVVATAMDPSQVEALYAQNALHKLTVSDLREFIRSDVN